MTEKSIKSKIERSSLGTTAAKSARKSVPLGAAAQVVARAAAQTSTKKSR